jgi:adenylosuccinate synthase
MEFGATTGRARRCGWIDLPQLKYTILLNGVTELCMTKIDVLNTFAEIQAATLYRYDGLETSNLPFDLCTTELETLYMTFPGWETSLDEVTTFDALPAAAQGFIAEIETYLGVPVRMVSTGPEREKLLVR